MLVTLTTDFGIRDGYVAAMKGAMLRVAPTLTMLDVTHDVPARDVMAAAFILRTVVPHVPAPAVHLMVVDPGVGTDRRAVAARFEFDGEEHVFVGPDNGLLPLLAGASAVRESVVLDRPSAWACPTPSDTFHGRDIFGPVAAALADGAELRHVGSPGDTLASMHWPLPLKDDEGMTGMVLHVDQFGNCITNFTAADIELHSHGRSFKCYVGSAVVQLHARTYGEVAYGDALSLFGSNGHLEIAVHGGNAAELFNVERGAPVTLVFEAARVPSYVSDVVHA